MNKTLLKTFETAIDLSIQEYITKVSNKYSIPVEELKDLVDKDPKNLEEHNSDSDTILSDSSSDTNSKVCIHVIGGSSARKGQICGKPVKCEKTQPCKIHLDAKEKKSAKSIIKKAKAAITFHPQFNKYYCEATGLLFEKNGDKFEAVSIYKGQEIRELNAKDIKTCKIFNYLVKSK